VTFFVVAWKAHPDIRDLLGKMADIPIANRQFGYLVAALIVATFNPWMVFYQQAAVADKKLGPRDRSAARVETAAVVTDIALNVHWREHPGFHLRMIDVSREMPCSYAI
jgi:Mn2+/Fe2+ NRAMP family transporter